MAGEDRSEEFGGQGGGVRASLRSAISLHPSVAREPTARPEPRSAEARR